MKLLHENLKYVFLDTEKNCPEIISFGLQEKEEEKLVHVLKKHKSAMGSVHHWNFRNNFTSWILIWTVYSPRLSEPSYESLGLMGNDRIHQALEK